MTFSFYVTKRKIFSVLMLFLGMIFFMAYFSKIISSKASAMPIIKQYYQEPIFGTEYYNEIYVLTKNTSIREQKKQELDDIWLLAQLCQAEAGNQGNYGMRMVADVVLNRVDSHKYPNSIEEVIFDPHQFGVITDGAFDEAGKRIREDSYEAAKTEYYAEERLDSSVLYFNNSPECSGKNIIKIGGHWFGY